MDIGNDKKNYLNEDNGNDIERRRFKEDIIIEDESISNNLNKIILMMMKFYLKILPIKFFKKRKSNYNNKNIFNNLYSYISD